MDTNGKVNPMNLQVDFGLESADPVRRFAHFLMERNI